MAEAHGLPCTPHSANLPTVTLFTLHFLRATANAGQCPELPIKGADYDPWQEGLFVESPYHIIGGCATVAAAPRVEINPNGWRRPRIKRAD